MTARKGSPARQAWKRNAREYRYTVEHWTEETTCEQCGRLLSVGDYVITDSGETFAACSSFCATAHHMGAAQ